MRTILAAAALAVAPHAAAGLTVETPGPQDIPQPVEVGLDLAGSGRPDIARFLNVRTATAPSLSPDGSEVSFRTSITGAPQVWAVDAAGGWPRQLTFGEPVTFHEWSPRGDWIAYGVDRGGNEREGVYLISPDGADERELLAPSDAFRVFGGFSRDGTKIAYATTSGDGPAFDIHVLDVDSGHDRRVLEGRMGLYVDGWRPDGGALLLMEARGEDAFDIHLLHLDTGRLETIFRPEEAAAYAGFAWVPKADGFYVATNQGHDLSYLAFWDAPSGTLAPVDAPPHEVESVSISPGGRFYIYTLNDGGRTTLRVMDTRFGRRVKPPDLPPGVYSVTWAPNAAVAAISVSGPGVPGDIWVWNVLSNELTRATRSSTAGLDMRTMVVPEHVEFDARDGETLRGLLYLPAPEAEERESMPPPVVLHVHGGPTGQARPRFNPVVQYLLTRGVAVFDLNFRGSTGYGKRFTRLDNQRLRPGAVLDMADAMAFLKEDGRVDASRAAVMGGSYGGYMTFAAVTQLPGVFDAGVSFVGVSDWVAALEGASPQLKASDRLEYGDIDDPNDREFFRSISPITHVRNVRAPVMVIHGANDPRDPVTESDRFVRAVREQGGEVEYLRFPDEGHGIRKLANRLTCYRRVAEFLERTLSISAASEATPQD